MQNTLAMICAVCMTGTSLDLQRNYEIYISPLLYSLNLNTKCKTCGIKAEVTRYYETSFSALAPGTCTRLFCAVIQLNVEMAHYRGVWSDSFFFFLTCNAYGD